MSCTDCDEIKILSPIPGAAGDKGDQGDPGAQGPTGIGAFSTLGSPFTQPAVGANVDVTVVTSAWNAVGQAVFVEVGGYYTVVSILSATSLRVRRENIGTFAGTGVAIAAGSRISAAGLIDNSQYTALAARVTALEGAAPVTPIQTYYQATPPAGPIVTGSIWFDTDDNNKMYRWDGSGWVLASQTIVITDFGTGLKAVSIRHTLPVGDPDDLRLIVLDTDWKLYRFNGTAWTAAVAAGDITGTLPGGVFGANTIATGVLQAGVILAANIGTNLVITDAANIGTGVIIDAHVESLSAGKLTAGTIDSVVVKIAGATGALQSDNFISGSQGFQVKGDGSAEFNGVVIRGTLEAGKIRTDGQFFNAADSSRTMPAVALVTDDVIAANGGTVNIGSGVTVNPTWTYLTSNSLIFSAWGVGATGYLGSRVGNTTFRGIVSINGNCAPATAGQLCYAPVFRVRTNGGAWGAWQGPGFDNYSDFGTVARNLQYTAPVTITIGAGDEIQFGVRFSKNNAGTTGTIGGCQVTAVGFSV